MASRSANATSGATCGSSSRAHSAARARARAARFEAVTPSPPPLPSTSDALGLAHRPTGTVADDCRTRTLVGQLAVVVGHPIGPVHTIRPASDRDLLSED